MSALRLRALVFLALAAALAGCDKRNAKPSDNVIVEVHAPIQAVVRVHEFDVKPECTETGLARFRCFFQSELRGCTWLELGADNEVEKRAAAVFGDDADTQLCDTLASTGTLATLDSVPLPARGMELAADPTGSRLAFRPAPDKPWRVFYLLGGEILGEYGNSGTPLALDGRPSPDDPLLEARPPAPLMGPLDWSRVPTLSDRAADFLPRAFGDHQRQLLKMVEEKRGEVGLGRALAGIMDTSEEPSWLEAWKRLGPSGRKAFQDVLARSLEEYPSEAALRRLSTAPELRPAGFADVLAKNLELQLEQGTQDFESTRLFVEALVQLDDARAGPLACEWLQDLVSEQLVSLDDYYPGMPVLESADPALIAIARFRTPCPWVRLALEREPCNVDYRCTPSGLIETSAQAESERQEAEDKALERGEELPSTIPQHPLCTPEQVGRVVKAWIPGWLSQEPLELDDVNFPEDLTSPPPGALLLAAAYAQGPLPADVLHRNARRLYRIDDRSPPVAEDDGSDPSACQLVDQGLSDPPELACRVPADLSRLRLGGCRIEIDDAKKVIRLTPPKAPAPVSQARPE
ncbi:MAG: hypothetical protein AB1938_10330 [Myxococcota bacterium]